MMGNLSLGTTNKIDFNENSTAYAVRPSVTLSNDNTTIPTGGAVKAWVANRPLLRDQAAGINTGVATEVTLTDAYTNYGWLIFQELHYGNVIRTVIVTSDYFAETTSGTRIVINSTSNGWNGNQTIEFYKGSSTTKIYYKIATACNANTRFRVYGLFHL